MSDTELRYDLPGQIKMTAFIVINGQPSEVTVGFPRYQMPTPEEVAEKFAEAVEEAKKYGDVIVRSPRKEQCQWLYLTTGSRFAETGPEKWNLGISFDNKRIPEIDDAPSRDEEDDDD